MYQVVRRLKSHGPKALVKRPTICRGSLCVRSDASFLISQARRVLLVFSGSVHNHRIARRIARAIVVENERIGLGDRTRRLQISAVRLISDLSCSPAVLQIPVTERFMPDPMISCPSHAPPIVEEISYAQDNRDQQ